MVRPNVLLVSLDSVRADAYFEMHYPTIQRLIAEGTSYRTVVSSAPLTPVSHSSILSGLQPYHHGVRHLFRERLDPHVITLPMVLKGSGYTTGGFVACAGLHRWYGLCRGFDEYVDEVPPLPDGRNPLDIVDVATRGSAYTRAEEMFRKASHWIADHCTQPFFAFVHFFDAHWPYDPPLPFRDQYADHHPYYGEIGYMDHFLGKLLECLETWGILETTLIVCLGDHGEDLGEHGGPSSVHPEEFGHGCLLSDVTQLVPLTFRLPGIIPSGRIIREQVRLVDVAPTIADLLGVNSMPKTDGISLRASLEGEPVPLLVGYSETFFPEEVQDSLSAQRRCRALKAVRVSHGNSAFKVVWEADGDGFETYYLSNDPGEQRNIGGSRVNVILGGAGVQAP